ncbi:MAG: fatty acid desaturase [Gammaproteobacteria bacterium]|nr:fatty acid desaturase [Gammaproteobacteria bacterium]
MAEVRRKLQVRWYRCPIDREVLKALSQPSDARGFIQALGHLGLWLVTGSLSFYFYTQGAWLGFFVLLFVHGTVATFFTAPQHELCHRTVFKTKWLNDAFVHVFSTLAWLNFRIYQFSHNYHHRYTLHLEGDREEVLPVTPSLRILYLLQLFTINIQGGYQSRGMLPTIRNFILIASDRFDNPFNSWGPELYEGHDKQRLKAVHWARWVLAFHAGVVVVALMIGQPVLILIVSASPFIANWLRYFVGVPMHCGLKTNVNDFRKCARTITLDPISEFLYWHMNWHLEHHMFAAVPCYNLKQLHRQVADDMPRPRTLTGAWREMRDTWRRQQSDPDYAFDTPVPAARDATEATDPADDLAAGLGELGPREIN